MPSLSEMILGCLLTGALGDSLGADVENQPARRHQLPVEFRVTDDTQLTLATCDSIISRNQVDPEDIAAHFADGFRNRRFTGLGASTLKALIELEAGGHWAMTGATGERTAGNGAAMRIAPLAFFLNPVDDLQRRTIHDVCRITHRNDEAYLGALSVIHAIRNPQIESQRIQFLVDELPDSRIRDRFIEITCQSLSLEQLAQQYPPSGYVVDSVPFAILAATSVTDALQGLKRIIECGGDTDTNASIFGNIFGAQHGVDALPQELIEQIDQYPAILETASNLAQLTSVDFPVTRND